MPDFSAIKQSGYFKIKFCQETKVLVSLQGQKKSIW